MAQATGGAKRTPKKALRVRSGWLMVDSDSLDPFLMRIVCFANANSEAFTLNLWVKYPFVEMKLELDNRKES